MLGVDEGSVLGDPLPVSEGEAAPVFWIGLLDDGVLLAEDLAVLDADEELVADAESVALALCRTDLR